MKKLPLKEQHLIGWFYDKLDEGKIEFIDNKAGLIDLIANFSEEKKRTDKVKYGIKIWEHLFKEALNALGGSTRGVNRLAEKLRAFAEFEELLYGADPWYREHTLHPLYVFVLGEYLMDKSNLDFKDLIGPRGAINEEIEASWCIISLAHDLGIPLDRITKIGESTLKTLKKYGEYSVQPFSFEFPYPTLKIVENLIEILSLEYKKLVKSGDQIIFKSSEEPGYGYDISESFSYGCTRVGLPPALRDAIAIQADVYLGRYVARISSKNKISLWESFNRKDHPLLSCLLLYQNVEYFKDVVIVPESDDEEDVIKVMKRRDLLRGIVAHDSPDVFRHCQPKSIAFLLLLCDELAEWSRPTRAGRLGERLESICDVYLEDFNSSRACFTFDFSNYKDRMIDPEGFFSDKCDKFKEIIVGEDFLSPFKIKFAVNDSEMERAFDWDLPSKEPKIIC